MIEVRDVWKDYPGRPGVLRGVTLDLAPGERVALVGPNGSGKTTLMRVLLGMVAYRGSVQIMGHDPLVEHAASQTHVAYVPQRSPGLNVPIRDLVAFWETTRRGDRQRLETLCAAFHLELGSLWSQRFVSLSGGMQQKLLSAMALATSCPILLLDEPTANLDPIARATFFASLTDRSPSPTLVLSSHRLDELKHLVDRVVVLADGRVTFDDRLDRFLSDAELAASAGLELGGHALPFRRPA